MNAFKNVTHLAFLSLWACLGALFALQSLFGAHALVPVIAFAGWFVGYAVLTSLVVRAASHPVGAVATHLGAALLMALVPPTFPFSLLRVGLDVALHHAPVL
jgi:Na+-translocating ferredoxin:NAD+ oxidoreductase RnfD subunit